MELFQLAVLSLLWSASAFAQKPPTTPIGPAACAALRQQYMAAISAGNGALVNQLGKELNSRGCNTPPKTSPPPPAVAYSVGSVQSVTFGQVGPGEGQSTVVPPGKNKACPAGRLLISDDWLRPSGSIVVGRDLSGNAADTISTFDNPSHPEYYSYVTNDHDLIALNDGTVLYLTGAGSIEPLKVQPPWWNVAYRGAFGPGARGILMTWRSTDCGATFHYVSEMDPALAEDGTCANPQPPLDSSNHYGMGGSDGQLVKLDPSNDNLYLTFRCVGNTGTTDAKGKFTLTSNGLNKTLVALSNDRGGSWKSMGYIDGVNWWRFGIVPVGNRIAFGFANDVVFGTPSNGKLAFGQAQPLSGQYGGFAWSTSPFNPNPSPDQYVFSNVWGNTLIARAGEAQGLLLGFPTVVGSGAKATNGYSVFFHNPNGSGYSEIPAIVPLTHSSSSYVMDVTTIDLGHGPVMLYWTDINTSSHKQRIRGRIIMNLGQYSADFDITGDQDITVPSNNYFPSAPAFFYGDYHTASGYIQKSPVSESYHFYPFWVDRAGGARFAVVTVSEATGLPGARQLQVSTIAANQWKVPPASVDLRNFTGKLPQVKETEKPLKRPSAASR
jgi:hypothetical protein